MTLAEKYGIQKGKEIERINLDQNPYKFEGTFKELYDLVAAGRITELYQNGWLAGISVNGYETTEADNLAGKAFMEAYRDPILAMKYFDLAKQLVEANLIPTVVSEDPLTITILNGLVTLDINGDEIKEQVDATDGCNDVYKVPGKVAQNEKDIRNYIRLNEGRCLARGCKLNIHYNLREDVYEVTGIQWGRKLTEAELLDIEYQTK